MLNLHSIAVSNRFVAEGLSADSAARQAAQSLAQGTAEIGIAVAFTSSLLFERGEQSRRELELVAPSEYWATLAKLPGFRAITAPGWIKHAATGVPIRLHAAGQLVCGGPVSWPDPAKEAEYSDGIPVLRLNAYLETEITRALNNPDSATYAANVVAAIKAGRASQDRVLELHPFVAFYYHECWERAQSRRLWSAVA